MKLEVIEKIRENRNISYKIGFFFILWYNKYHIFKEGE
jgi:hypothetical protein